VLRSVDAVAGYTTYIELIRPLIRGKTIICTPMKKEIQRAGEAIDTALAGTPCAMVSSGDAGIYAMAGLVLELCRERDIAIVPPDSRGSTAECLEIEVVPGIPALCAGAALLGAPLTHDFAVISLSDLLTPWETIEKRLEAAAAADFVIVLYNPRSRKRDWQLEKACRIALGHRSPQTPVGIVTRAAREGQSVRVVPLEALASAPVDMQTIVFIGNSTTFTYGDRMVTPRGYTRKYRAD
jgi:precorrin-3B C17-methyltransferase